MHLSKNANAVSSSDDQVITSVITIVSVVVKQFADVHKTFTVSQNSNDTAFCVSKYLQYGFFRVNILKMSFFVCQNIHDAAVEYQNISLASDNSQ